MADRLVNEVRDLILEPDHGRAIRRGEIGLVSGVSSRFTDLQLDHALACRWHLCFRRFGYRTLVDIVFEPCAADIETGILDIEYL